MLQPRKLKYRKSHTDRFLKNKIATKGSDLDFGEAGLKSLEAKFITDKQIEACLSILKKGLGKKGKYWLRIFPQIPKTKKPAETRMGGGKGDVEEYVAAVKPGTMIVEVAGLDKNSLKNVLKAISYKLPIKTKIVEK